LEESNFHRGVVDDQKSNVVALLEESKMIDDKQGKMKASINLGQCVVDILLKPIQDEFQSEVAR